jgi:CheY-like chemotaxis protein
MTMDPEPTAEVPPGDNRQAVLARLAAAHARDSARVDRAALEALGAEMRVCAGEIASSSHAALEALPGLHPRLAAGVRRIEVTAGLLAETVEDALDLDRVPAGQFPGEWEALAARLRGYLRPALVPFPAYVALVAEDPAGTGYERLMLEMDSAGGAAGSLAALVEDVAALAGALAGDLPPEEVPDSVRAVLERIGASVRPHPATVAAAERVLVVDDSAGNRAVLDRILARLGYRVTLAVGGREAQVLLGEEVFGLVLLDITMPEVDGFQVLQGIRADQALRVLPVIVLAAPDESGSVARAIEMGAEDYAAPPFDPVLLRVRVGAALERAHLRDQLQRRPVRSRAEAERW